MLTMNFSLPKTANNVDMKNRLESIGYIVKFRTINDGEEFKVLGGKSPCRVVIKNAGDVVVYNPTTNEEYLSSYEVSLSTIQSAVVDCAGENNYMINSSKKNKDIEDDDCYI